MEIHSLNSLVFQPWKIYINFVFLLIVTRKGWNIPWNCNCIRELFIKGITTIENYYYYTTEREENWPRSVDHLFFRISFLSYNVFLDDLAYKSNLNYIIDIFKRSTIFIPIYIYFLNGSTDELSYFSFRSILVRISYRVLKTLWNLLRRQIQTWPELDQTFQTRRSEDRKKRIYIYIYIYIFVKK